MQHMDEGRLQAWLDGPAGGLSDAERVQVADHLAECHECSARLETLQASDARVRDLLAAVGESEDRIPDFSAVAARAGGRSDGDGRRRPRRIAPAWAASILVALGAGWLWNEMTRTGTEPGLVRPEARANRVFEEEVWYTADEIPVDSVRLVPDVRVLAAPEPGDEPASESDRAAALAPDTPRAPDVARNLVRIPPEWRPMTAAQAEAFAGFRPRTVPGLTVESVSAMGFMVDQAAVRVIQRLPGGEELVLLQFATVRAAEGFDPAVAPQEGTADTVGVASVALPDGVLVTARAPVALDSVRVLLERLR